MITRIIPSGSFRISPKKREVMRGFLGSCVGVTLVDEQAGIGGFIHLLLPEPPSMDISWNQTVSAQTGMPFIINELCRRGAVKKRLQACIAGGALVDPVSKTDLALDIGGRTAEIALHILNKEKIHVLLSEVGGFLSCCMQLDLWTWKTTVEPFITPAATDELYSHPGAGELQKAIDSVTPIPQIALKIIRMINDDNHDFREIAGEVLQDQVLSAKIMKACNSISLNPVNKVNSIEKALVRIGEQNLMRLVLSFAMDNFTAQANRGYSLCKGGIFHHSVWTARISGRLAELTGVAPYDLVYTAGLLHDIGKVVLDQFTCNVHPLFYREFQDQEVDLTAAEKSLFGLAHTDAGHLLATQWHLPAFIGETALHHHNPENMKANRHIAFLVHAADILSSNLLLGCYLNKDKIEHLHSSLKSIGINSRQIPELLAHASLAAFDLPNDPPA